MTARAKALLALLLCLLAVSWLLPLLEWDVVDGWSESRGEARSNRWYATQRLLRELGAELHRQPALTAAPPPGATLVLTGRHWGVMSDGAEVLHDWVQAGGHLVIATSLADDDGLYDWLPIEEEEAPEKVDTPKKPSRAPAAASSAPAAASPAVPADRDCRPLREAGATPVAGGSSRYWICGWAKARTYSASAGHRPLWRVDGALGTELLRVRIGRGTVTMADRADWWSNRNLLRGDNARMLVAALQPRAGTAYWFIDGAQRQTLVDWLWQNAWPVFVLLGLLLLSWLWRHAPRFGPRLALAPAARRAMAEQVRGTGAFLHAQRSPALHAAQLRALHEVAAAVLQGFAQATPDRQAARLAQATGVAPPAVVARALALRPRKPAVLAADLDLLETLRRRLLASRGAPRSPEPLTDTESRHVHSKR